MRMEPTAEDQTRRRYRYVLRYVLAVGGMEFFAFKVLDPYYLQFMTTDRGLNLSPTQFGAFVSLASGVTLATDYLTGAFADKLGRRTSWAIAMFLYGGGMLWLSSVNGFVAALATAVCMGACSAFASGAREAWLYDTVGEEGMRQGFGKLYLYGVPMAVAGALVATALGALGSVRIPIAATGLLVLADGLFILTFPENYGGASSRSWLEVMKAGARQFLRSRILWLTALQSFFMTLPVWITSAWWVTYLSTEFHVDVAGVALAFGITATAAAVAGACLARMRATEYTRLILYPTLLMAVAFLLMPLAPSPALFVPLVMAAIACGYFRTSGITLLENEQIAEERATALSFLSSLRSGFWMAGPMLWAALIGRVGLKVTFACAAVACALSLGILAGTLRLRKVARGAP
jgi:DHA1 family tetracycline resistance protein-like MFS transporter